MILAPTLLLNAGSGAAIARPTFSRDFAGEKTLNNGTGPAITFTRASNATYFDADGVLQTASNDAPRFDHSGGSSLGLLIEEARTNLLERSAEFENAYWTKTAASITANATAAPDGTTSADALVEDATLANHIVSRTTSFATATNYTLSVFAKANTRSRLRFVLSNGATVFGSPVTADYNLQTASVTGSSGTPTTSIQSVGNGWLRLSISKLSVGAASEVSSIRLIDESGLVNYTGDGTSGLYIWGAQLEAGAFPTSYIPTTSAAATRAADSAVVTPISSFYNQAEGTLFAEWFAVTKTASLAIADFNNSNTTQRIGIITTSSSIPSFAVRNSGNICDIDVGSAIAANSTTKMAGAFAQNDFQAARAGVLGTPDTSGALPEIAVMRFGTNASTSSPAHINGHIRKIAYWPRRLSNTLLEQLTT